MESKSQLFPRRIRVAMIGAPNFNASLAARTRFPRIGTSRPKAGPHEGFAHMLRCVANNVTLPENSKLEELSAELRLAKGRQNISAGFPQTKQPMRGTRIGVGFDWIEAHSLVRRLRRTGVDSVQYFINDSPHLSMDIAHRGCFAPFLLHSFNSCSTVSGVVSSPVWRLT
jgi:hypothetical protein